MEGSLKRQGTKDGQPTWRIVVDAGRDPVTKRRRQITRTFRGSERAAKTYRAKLVAEVADGRHAGSSSTVGFLLDRWLEHAAVTDVTRDDYRRVVETYLRPKIGKMQLHRVRASDIDRIYDGLRGKVGPARIRRVHTVIRSALAQAVRWEWLSYNPAISASPPPVLKKEIRPPSPAQVGKLLALAAKDFPDLLAFVYLAVSTGARKGELCGLQWGDLDTTTGKLTIRRAVAAPKGGMVIKETKTGKVRMVSLNKPALDVLASWRLRCAETSLGWGMSLEDRSFIFAADGNNDWPWRPERVSKRFAELRDAAELPGLTVRLLRHYVATQLIAAGVDPVTVSGILGHDRTSTTLDMYAQWVPGKDQEAADLLEEILKKAR